MACRCYGIPRQPLWSTPKARCTMKSAQESARYRWEHRALLFPISSFQFRISTFWSARVTLNYRALALKRPDGFLWFWIGDHKTYEELI
jgi:hypothetical protein